MKRALTIVALLALACAGFASAGGLTKIILQPGACVTLGNWHVCAAKAKAKTVKGKKVVTVKGKTVTVTVKGTPVTVTIPGTPPPPVTVTVTTTTQAAPPPPTTTTTPTYVSRQWSGTGTSGNQTLDSFTTAVPETVTWTSSWPDGAGIGDPNGDFNLYDNLGSGSQVTMVNWDSTGSGSVALPAGTHQFTVLDESGSTWHVSVG